MKPPPGMVFIYALVAEGDGPRYIGVTKQSLKYRLASHLYDARKGKKSHKCNWLRQCFREGRSVKIVEIVQVSEAAWPEWEKGLIERANLRVQMTNGCAGGRGVLTPTEQTLMRMRAANRSKDPAVRAKISASNRLQMEQNPAAKLALSEAMRERMSDPKVRASVSAVHSGKTMSAETRAKLSAALKKHYADPAARQAASLRSSGWSHSPEARAKISAAGIGRKRTAETKAKMAAAVRKRRSGG